MQRVVHSPRLLEIEKQLGLPIKDLLHSWHWKENLKHSEIGKKLGIPRPTITRWFGYFKIPSQSCTRFTNLNLLNTGPRKTPPAKLKIKKDFPWKFDKNFFKKWSPKMAYVLGFLVADGYVFTNRRGSHYIGFTSTDKEIIEKIRTALKSNHAIGVRRPRVANGNREYVLQIGSMSIVKYLEKFGIVQNKSLKIRFPKNIPIKFLGHFVRGYFDGDGCIYFKKHWAKDRKKMRWVFQTRFTSGSYLFLVGLRDALKRYTSGGFIQEKTNHRGFDLVYSHRDSFALFSTMYNNILDEPFLNRKYAKFRKAIDTLYI